VTKRRVLGCAAYIEAKGVIESGYGWHGAEGGAVWSHIRIARQSQLHAPVFAGRAEKPVLGCDLVVSANNELWKKLRSRSNPRGSELHESITSEFGRTFAMQAESGNLEAHPDPNPPPRPNGGADR